MSSFRFLFVDARRATLPAIACGVVSGAASAAFVPLVSSRLASSGSSALLLATLSALLLCVTCNALAQLLLNTLSGDALRDLRMRLGRQLLCVPLQKLEGMGKHRVLSVLTDDISQIAAGLGNVPTLCIYGSTLLVCFALLLWISPAVFALWATFVAAGSLAYHRLQRRAVQALTRAAEHEDTLCGYYTALADGGRELRSNRARRFDFVHGALERAASGNRAATLDGMHSFTAARTLGDGLYLTFLVLFVWLLADALSLPAPTRSSVLLLMIFSMTPTIVLVNLAPIFARMRVAVNNVAKLGLSLGEQATPAERVVRESLERRMRARPYDRFARLELSGVAFEYESDTGDGFRIGPLDLQLAPGEVVFLSGGNGGGKSTLAKVLTGLYAPSAGRLALDGRSVADETRDDYRQLFSTVWSDCHLFEQLPDHGADPSVITTYLEKLGLTEKVRIIDGDRLSTVRLSQGQRKRLALFFALLEDRPCIVLDEWAADQDPKFRRFFYEELLGELRARGKSVFAITHDEHYFHVADRLLRLDNGTLSSLEPPRLHASFAAESAS